jgi:hypothetical protein
MKNFFELEHIFVVFPPGSSGNFISNLIRNIISNTMTEQQLSSSGNAHHDPGTGNPLGCNILYLYPNHQLITDNDKINFYKKDIETKFLNDLTVKVSWTHDFSNISFYKKLFPNCKILVITTETRKEKITAMILQELKNTLDTHGYVFVDDEEFRKPLIIRTARMLKEMSNIKDMDYLIKLLDNGRSPKNFPLFVYLTIYSMMTYYEFTNEKYDLLDYCINPAGTITGIWDQQIIKVIGPKYQDCVTDDCIKLHFSDIVTKNSKSLIDRLEILLGIILTEKQKIYVSNSLKQYIEKQNQEVLSNPKKYFETIKSQALLRIQELKNETD